MSAVIIRSGSLALLFLGIHFLFLLVVDFFGHMNVFLTILTHLAITLTMIVHVVEASGLSAPSRFPVVLVLQLLSNCITRCRFRDETASRGA